MVGPEFLRTGEDREKDIFVTNFELEKDHFLRIKPLYEALHNLLADDGWGDPKDGSDKFEHLYWERHLANGMKEHHIWWRVVREPPGKHEFVRYAIKIDFQTLAVSNAEIPYQSKKTKVERADFILRMWFWVQWDYKKKISKSWVRSFEIPFLRQLYRSELGSHVNFMLTYANKLRQFAKDYLDMEEPGERPRQFAPEGGYKDQF